MTEAVPIPPPLQGPTAKEKKYDRQLRLWGANGQIALEQAHVLLVNSGSGVIGVETLKNLVLPGIGQFTIQDPHIVEDADLGVNFFLTDECVGKSRAEQTSQFLQELNPDVKGYAISEPIETFIANPTALAPYTHILLSAPIHHDVLESIVTQAADSNTPLFYIHDVGFYFHFSVSLPPAFPIIDTHPDPSSIADLRLTAPWPALSQFADEATRNIDTLSDHAHGHIPYALILLWAVETWKKEHDGRVPSTYKEKNALRDMVRKSMRTSNAEGGEENWEEAIAAVLKSLNPPTASSAVREVFDAPECKNLTAASSNFWIIANAISQFYAKNGVLPLSGSLPDMKAQSSDYIRLQTLYKSKAREDAEEVLVAAWTLESQLHPASDAAEVARHPIAAAEVEAFCKNAGYIKLIRGRRLQIVKPGSPATWGDRARWARNALGDPSMLLLIHIAFLAWDAFTFTHESNELLSAPQPPGISELALASDTEKLVGIAHKIVDDLITEAGQGQIEDPEYSEIKQHVGDICAELSRAGGAELHNIASLAGGMVSQEVIKVITQQYIPVDNTCIFDGVKSMTAVFRI